jgi:rhamnogalacturonan acetylesterase
MFSWSTVFAAGLAITGAQGTPVEVARRATPTVYLAGDSTMAKTGGQHMGE